MAELIQAGDFITESERHAARHLKGLPDRWTVICNKEIVTPQGSTYEVDFVIIGEHSIFVVDEKSWSGRIYGNENEWVLPGAEARRSPIQKMGHVARQLAGLLRGRIPYLHQNAANSHFVFDVILLSAPSVDIAGIHDPRMNNHVLKLSDSLEELLRMDRQFSSLDLVTSQPAIRTLLTGLKNRPPYPKRINAYSVEEVIEGGRGFYAVRAKHRDGDERIIKLYEIDPVTQPRESLRRDYYATRQAHLKNLSPAVDPEFFWNDDRFFAIPFHLPSGSPVRLRATAEQLSDPGYAIRLTVKVFQALIKLHAIGLVHRLIDPDSIYVSGATADLNVQFFNFMFARLDQRASIAEELDEYENENVYLAPECRVGFGFGEQASDTYGAALSICRHLSGIDPASEEIEGGLEGWFVTAMISALTTWPEAIAEDYVELLKGCVTTEMRDRPAATFVVDKLEGLLQTWTSAQASPQARVPATLGNGQYRVIRKLGEGASAITYLVEETLYDGGKYVLKHIKNIAAVDRFVRTEFNALKELIHPNLPRLYDVRPPSDDYHLKLEYIPGTQLADCMDTFRGRPDRILQLATPLLKALEALEEHGISHRDISPKNIIVPDEGDRTCLIDFGLARLREDSRTSAVGTPLYRDPNVEREGWSKTSDLYSIAVVLYEALTGDLPFVVENGSPRKSVLRPLLQDEEKEFNPSLLTCLRRAAGFSSERYPDAKSFLRALSESVTSREPQQPGAEVHLAWARQIRGLYRNSASGNPDNRGLDSDFARVTYVPTRLDSSLLPDIAALKKSLVLLTGNPGDGKTAFLEKVRDDLSTRGGLVTRADRYGWELDYAGKHFEAIFDASESRGDRSDSEVLKLALAPFSGDHAPDLPSLPTLLVAINDGRLHKFLNSAKESFGWLSECITKLIFEDAPTNDYVEIVDLKRRALVNLPGKPGSMFSRMLSGLVAAPNWAECESCSAREDCSIKFNADRLSNPQIASRLESLFLIQHWRRNRRATIRDVRSSLAYLITGNLVCEDIHRERREQGLDEDWNLRPYFHAVFNPRGEKDEMLDDLASVDPAQRAHPRLDRFLHFHRSTDRWASVLDYTADIEAREPFNAAMSPELLDKRWYGAIKRRLYFEADDEKLRNGGWELPESDQMLPYRYLADFAASLTGAMPADDVLTRLVDGISRAEGVPKTASNGRLSLSLARNADQELTVIKQFDPSQFRCSVVTAADGYVESIPDAIRLFHVSGAPSITVTLDMFELLSRLADGYTAGTQEFEPFFVELREFKSGLLRMGVNEILLLEGRSRLHRVALENGTIALKESVR